MVGWMDGWLDDGMDGWLDVWMYVCMYVWTDRCMDAWIDVGCMESTPQTLQLALKVGCRLRHGRFPRLPRIFSLAQLPPQSVSLALRHDRARLCRSQLLLVQKPLEVRASQRLYWPM